MHEKNAVVEYTETYSRLSKERVIFLAEDVTKTVAAQMSALLLYYNSVSKDEVTLYINSYGGDSAGLINIYDVMQMLDAPIKTICVGKACSASAVLLASGEPGKRYALKNSQIMIHGIQCGFPLLGHDVVNSKNYYEFLKDHNDTIMKIMAKHSGQTLKKIKEDCKEDIWMSAKQALDYGLIDKIL